MQAVLLGTMDSSQACFAARRDLHALIGSPVSCRCWSHCCASETFASNDTGCCAALQVLEPILYERDRYLTWALQRSKAVNGSRLVVGVVGLMHLRGISETLSHWESAEPLRFREVVGSSRRRKKRGEFGPGRRLLAEAVVAGAASWAWLSWHH